jgi:hypothetical protein
MRVHRPYLDRFARCCRSVCRTRIVDIDPGGDPDGTNIDRDVIVGVGVGFGVDGCDSGPKAVRRRTSRSGVDGRWGW